MPETPSRQAVVFVRINNMDTLEVEGQQTYVIDLDENENLTIEEVYREALQQAFEKAQGV